jgi:hypothetical protein
MVILIRRESFGITDRGSGALLQSFLELTLALLLH